MSRRFSEPREAKTNPAQQRINRAKSVATLARLLQLNFQHGARLIVLAYEPGGYVPVGAYADPDISDWLRLCAKQLGGGLQYVRATAQEPATVHRVIMGIESTEAKALAGLWEYGPAWVEEIEGGQFPALAEQLAGKPEAYRRSWTASRGLKRP